MSYSEGSRSSLSGCSHFASCCGQFITTFPLLLIPSGNRALQFRPSFDDATDELLRSFFSRLLGQRTALFRIFVDRPSCTIFEIGRHRRPMGIHRQLSLPWRRAAGFCLRRPIGISSCSSVLLLRFTFLVILMPRYNVSSTSMI